MSLDVTRSELDNLLWKAFACTSENYYLLFDEQSSENYRAKYVLCKPSRLCYYVVEHLNPLTDQWQRVSKTGCSRLAREEIISYVCRTEKEKSLNKQ